MPDFNFSIWFLGKEGKQASLAADWSLTQFSHVARLLLVHGRNSYKRSASLSQFVIHRGLIITTMQAIFSAVFYFSSVSLYQGFLMVGYATVYTMFPVFSLVNINLDLRNCDLRKIVPTTKILVEMVFCYQNQSDLLWEKNCWSGREQFLKFETEGGEFAKFLRSVKQFVWTVKGQNNFW